MATIYKNKSDVAGEGIFSETSFKKGSYICRLKGKIIKRKYNEETDRILCANWFGVGKDLWIDPAFPLSHINHSCEPNLGIKGKIMFYALRNIEAGEELTFDYSISEEEMDWKLKCNCGSKTCRKFVTSIQFIPKNIFKKYLPYIPTYFQKIYTGYNK